jgi:hypothetical protein
VAEIFHLANPRLEPFLFVGHGFSRVLDVRDARISVVGLIKTKAVLPVGLCHE